MDGVPHSTFHVSRRVFPHPSPSAECWAKFPFAQGAPGWPPQAGLPRASASSHALRRRGVGSGPPRTPLPRRSAGQKSFLLTRSPRVLRRWGGGRVGSPRPFSYDVGGRVPLPVRVGEWAGGQVLPYTAHDGFHPAVRRNAVFYGIQKRSADALTRPFASRPGALFLRGARRGLVTPPSPAALLGLQAFARTGSGCSGLPFLPRGFLVPLRPFLRSHSRL